MKRRASVYFRIVSVALSVLLTTLPLPVYAAEDGQDDNPASGGVEYISPVIITELHTGIAAAGDEFIELYNTSEDTVDISGWQLRYINADATNDTSTLIAGIEAGVELPGRTHFVLHTASVPPAVDVLGQQYTAKLSSKDKAIGLFAPFAETCEMRVVDAIAWGTSIHGEGTAIAVADTDTNKHVYRYRTASGEYIDTNTNAHDAGIATGKDVALTIGTLNSQVLETDADTWPVNGSMSPMAAVSITDCEVLPPPDDDTEPDPVPDLPPPIPVDPSSPPSVVQPVEDETDNKPAQPKMPARNAGLVAPQVSELLPNPAPPQTDANDEFIELYNPNNAPFELSGFMLEVGVTTKKRYTFPQGTLLEPKSFKAFFSKDTRLSLSNTQGQVWLLDPFGRIIGQSDPYQSAKDGQSWVFAEGKWQWTTVSTPGAVNVVKAPAQKKKASTTAVKASTTTSGTGKGSSASGADTNTKAIQNTQEPGDNKDSFNPLHPGILVVTGVVALLYAIYEYRRDLANRIHQFRTNRAARRAARQNVKGR